MSLSCVGRVRELRRLRGLGALGVALAAASRAPYAGATVGVDCTACCGRSCVSAFACADSAWTYRLAISIWCEATEQQPPRPRVRAWDLRRAPPAVHEHVSHQQGGAAWRHQLARLQECHRDMPNDRGRGRSTGRDACSSACLHLRATRGRHGGRAQQRVALHRRASRTVYPSRARAAAYLLARDSVEVERGPWPHALLMLCRTESCFVRSYLRAHGRRCHRRPS